MTPQKPASANPAPAEVGRIQELVAVSLRVLLVCHVSPDGDAIGSLLGLGRLLADQGKDVTLTCQDGLPEALDWLPGSSLVSRRGQGSYDLAIALDCSDQRRTGNVLEDGMEGVPLVNIDHHITNTRFGTVNWVDPISAATAQMVLALAQHLGWTVTADVATCLLTGLVTDTLSFRTSNVDEAVLEAALCLMKAGAPLTEISRRALSQRPLARVRLWGEAIRRLQLEGEVLWTEVTLSMRESLSLPQEGMSGLTNLLSGVREGSVVVVFNEHNDNTVDVGMRSVPGYDVSQVALALGGGGHPQAAGCTIAGELAVVRKLILQEVQRSLAEQQEATGN